MGCDIHSIGQILRDGGWETVIVRPGGDKRNYASFAVMADVRNADGWDVLYPRLGIPEDIGPMRDDCVLLGSPYYDEHDKKKKYPQHVFWLGEHSYSWLTLRELRNIKDYFSDKKWDVGELFWTLCLMIGAMENVCADRNVSETEARVVFGFDS